MGFNKAFHHLTQKRRNEFGVTYAIAMHLLPAPPGKVKVTYSRHARLLSTAELARLEGAR